MTKVKEEIYIMEYDSRYGFAMVFTQDIEDFLYHLPEKRYEELREEIRIKYNADLHNDIIPLSDVECEENAKEIAEGISELIENLMRNS